MFLIPISSYPMPAGENSRIQTLTEQKSELTQQIQVVGQSDMRENEKHEISRIFATDSCSDFM